MYVMREFGCPCGAIFEDLVDRSIGKLKSPCCGRPSPPVMSAPKMMTVWLSAAQGKSDPPPNAKSIDWAHEVGEGRNPRAVLERVRKIGRDRRLMQVIKKRSTS